MAWLFKTSFRQNTANYLTDVSLDISEDLRYFFFLSDHKAIYTNRYLWRYIERDVIFSLLSDTFVIAHLDSFEPIELDKELFDFYSNQINQNGEYTICLGVNDRRFITNIMEGQKPLWAYDDLINLKAFPVSESAKCSSKDFSSTDYILNIQPIGDDDGFSISINPQLQSRDEIIDKILIVLNEYHVKLEYREIDKVEEYPNE